MILHWTLDCRPHLKKYQRKSFKALPACNQTFRVEKSYRQELAAGMIKITPQVDTHALLDGQTVTFEDFKTD